MNKRQKIEKLYLTYRNAMFHEAFIILESNILAEDAVSETFVRIIRFLDKIECDNSFRTKNFLLTVCRNVAIDILKDQKNILCFDANDDRFMSYSTPEDIFINHESVNSLMNIIKSLPPIYRDTVLLNKVYHVSRGDIARIFGISPEAVTKRLQRAKAEIKKQLKKEDA